jgi:hypothetical protein
VPSLIVFFRDFLECLLQYRHQRVDVRAFVIGQGRRDDGVIGGDSRGDIHRGHRGADDDDIL